MQIPRSVLVEDCGHRLGDKKGIQAGADRKVDRRAPAQSNGAKGRIRQCSCTDCSRIGAQSRRNQEKIRGDERDNRKICFSTPQACWRINFDAIRYIKTTSKQWV
eukprot:TRINITY_DN3461_c0_g1_i1.p3 TRINITY_DN3461_c0_g1~~TRINITY_DN3461_c0_g1_i1.p3  ORF type:complete len:105 (-),score=0.55 TRINITY_DN3461_c0_g1_i1:173-487(-)